MHFNMCTESNKKKRGREFCAGCGYTIETVGGEEKNDKAFLLMALLSVTTQITLKTISSKPMMTRFKI